MVLAWKFLLHACPPPCVQGPYCTGLSLPWAVLVERYFLPSLLVFMLNSRSLTNRHFNNKSTGICSLVLSPLASLIISLHSRAHSLLDRHHFLLCLTTSCGSQKTVCSSCVSPRHVLQHSPVTSVHPCRVQFLYPPSLLCPFSCAIQELQGDTLMLDPLV